MKSEEVALSLHLMGGDELLLNGALLGTVVVDGIVRRSGEVPQRGLQKLPLKSVERPMFESLPEGKTIRLPPLLGSSWPRHVGFGDLRSVSDEGIVFMTAVVD